MAKWAMMSLGVLWAVVFSGGPVFSAPVPDTGVTKCYDDVGTEIACPSAGERFYGQDGNFSINPPSYTKLDASGNDLPDSAASWSMVRDNVTGLIWEVKIPVDGAPDYSNPRDADNTHIQMMRFSNQSIRTRATYGPIGLGILYLYENYRSTKFKEKELEDYKNCHPGNGAYRLFQCCGACRFNQWIGLLLPFQRERK